ncbi:MAG: curli assembly protein CsgF [Pseudomonadota bacterium]
MIQLQRLSLLLLVCALSVQAGELVYEPVNPAFGGRSLNGTWLLNNAQAQNDKTDPDDDVAERTALDRFNDTMERLVLSRLSTAVVDQFAIQDVDTGIYTLVAGSYTVGRFQVDIVEDAVSGITTITTTDTETLQTTEIVIPR